MADCEAINYELAKNSSLRKYKLTPEAYRNKFRNLVKTPEESYGEFCYKLRVNFDEWLNGELIEGDFNKPCQLLCVEQFYKNLPEELRFWVKEPNVEKTIERAAEFADQYVSERGSRWERNRDFSHGKASQNFLNKQPKEFTIATNNERSGADQSLKKVNGNGQPEKNENEIEVKKRYFERRRRPITCFNCNGPHLISNCDKKNAVFTCIPKDSETFRHLTPYMIDCQLNGKKASILRDSAATHDVVSETWVSPDVYTGKNVWIRVALSGQSVCLPVVRVELKGPFGVISCEAAVTKNLHDSIPYLLTNEAEKALMVSLIVTLIGLVIRSRR